MRSTKPLTVRVRFASIMSPGPSAKPQCHAILSASGVAVTSVGLVQASAIELLVASTMLAGREISHRPVAEWLSNG